MLSNGKRWCWIVWGVAILISTYLGFPLIAGLLALGGRSGPRIFFRGHHTMLYKIGYGLTHEDKSRAWAFEVRPWFYGMDEQRLPPRKKTATQEGCRTFRPSVD